MSIIEKLVLLSAFFFMVSMAFYHINAQVLTPMPVVCGSAKGLLQSMKLNGFLLWSMSSTRADNVTVEVWQLGDGTVSINEVFQNSACVISRGYNLKMPRY